MKEYLKNLLQLVLSPANGWEDIAIEDRSPREIAAKGFYPLAAITGLTVLVSAFYSHHVEMFTLSLQALITGLSYFLAYFVGTFALSLFIEPLLKGNYNESRCETYSLYVIGLLASIKTIVNCLPVSYVMLFFLPFYVALVEWKGVSYLGIKESRVGVFMILAVFGLIVPPFLIDFLFTQIL